MVKVSADLRLDNKTAIITGCNVGIGKATAADFYKRGCRVLMACRDLDKANSAKKDIETESIGNKKVGTLIVKKLDLASFRSVRECAEEILQEEEYVHLLINNAGVMICPKGTTEDGNDVQFQTNHLGHFLFTLLLLPKMLKSTPARIVTVSSKTHFQGKIYFDDINSEKSYSPLEVFRQSKLSNVLFTKELARRLAGTGVTTYSLHPGMVSGTEIRRHWTGAWVAMEMVFGVIGKLYMNDPNGAAQAVAYCALDEKIRNDTGKYYNDGKEETPSSKAMDEDLAKKLWNVSSELVKLGSYDPFDSIGKT